MLSLINGMLLLSPWLLPYQPHILHLQSYVTMSASTTSIEPRALPDSIL